MQNKIINDKLSTGGEFRFGNYTLEELARITGITPAYIYSRTEILRRVQHIRRAFNKCVKIHYSIKANPNPHVVSYIASIVDGLDVASHAEMLNALATGTPASSISFSGPGKKRSELVAAIASGATIHIESAIELDRILDVVQYVNKAPRLAIRLNPDFKIRRSGMIMGGGSQPFGIDQELAGQLIEKMRAHELECAGLHCYAGSQILDHEILIDMQSKTLDMMSNIISEHKLSDISLNIGGGFGIPYFSGDEPLDINKVASHLDDYYSQLSTRKNVNELVIELGRYIVGEAGIYLARIVDRKCSRGKQFLVLEGGMNHQLAASGNLGQVIRRNFPIVCSVPDTGLEYETVSIVGPLCTPLDVLASNVLIPKQNVGDLLAIQQSGAYGYSASPHQFLSHPPPLELLV